MKSNYLKVFCKKVFWKPCRKVRPVNLLNNNSPAGAFLEIIQVFYMMQLGFYWSYFQLRLKVGIVALLCLIFTLQCYWKLGVFCGKNWCQTKLLLVMSLVSSSLWLPTSDKIKWLSMLSVIYQKQPQEVFCKKRCYSKFL